MKNPVKKKSVRKLRQDLEEVLPDEVKGMKRFLLWRSHFNPRRNKFLKTPFYARGQIRKKALDTEEDLSKLCSLSEALDALEKAPSYSGIGLALVGGDNIGAFDIDKCLNREGEVDPSHAGYDLIGQVRRAGGYIEVSPSGTGLRVLGKSKVLDAFSKQGVEYWGEKRFITITGTSWDNPRGWIDLTPFRKRLGVERERTEGAPLGELNYLVTPKMVREVVEALKYLDSDERDQWIRVGHALKPIGDKGKEIWLDWSRTSDKFDLEDAERVWGTFKTTNTGPKAIFAAAQREGWVNPGVKNERGGDEDEDEDGDESEGGKDEFLDLGWPEVIPTEYVLDGFIPTGVSLIAGAWGAGKSTNLIPLFACATHVVPNNWGIRTELRRKVIWVTEAPEQARDTLYSLFREIVGEDPPESDPGTPENGPGDPEAEDPGYPPTQTGENGLHENGATVWADLKEWFLLVKARRLPVPKLVKEMKRWAKEHSYWLELKDHPPYEVQPVIVLDTTAANILLEDENSNSQVSAAMAKIKEVLPGTPIVLIGHTPKMTVKADISEMVFRGAGAWEADAGTTFYLVYDQEINYRFLAIRKARFAPTVKEIGFETKMGTELVPTPWGTIQSKTFLHGVPRMSSPEERKALKDLGSNSEGASQGEEKQGESLTPRQEKVLDFITKRWEADSVGTWKSLASKELDISKNFISPIFSALEKKGLIEEHTTEGKGSIKRTEYKPSTPKT